MINNIMLGVKLLGVVSALFGVLYAGHTVKNWYEDQIQQAVNNAKIEATLERNLAIEQKETELQELAKAEKERLQRELDAERGKVSDLRRMLLIDHDLDRLLQQKPGLILPRVNRGTQSYFDELEEVTK